MKQVLVLKVIYCSIKYYIDSLTAHDNVFQNVDGVVLVGIK